MYVASSDVKHVISHLGTDHKKKAILFVSLAKRLSDCIPLTLTSTPDQFSLCLLPTLFPSAHACLCWTLLFLLLIQSLQFATVCLPRCLSLSLSLAHMTPFTFTCPFSAHTVSSESCFLHVQAHQTQTPHTPQDILAALAKGDHLTQSRTRLHLARPPGFPSALRARITRHSAVPVDLAYLGKR